MRYKPNDGKTEVTPSWTKHIMGTHPIVLISTIGRVRRKLIPGLAPFATCLDTSYDPPYVTFAAAKRQHSVEGRSSKKGYMNTVLNIRQNGLFVVNIPHWIHFEVAFLLNTLACPHNRSEYKDKFDMVYLTKVEPFKLSRHPVYPPLVGECVAHLECEAIDMHLPKGSDHYLITGRVVAASCAKDFVEGDNEDQILESLELRLAQEAWHHFGLKPGTNLRYFTRNQDIFTLSSMRFDMERPK